MNKREEKRRKPEEESKEAEEKENSAEGSGKTSWRCDTKDIKPDWDICEKSMEKAVEKRRIETWREALGPK